eukprot:snap_masked-scaffold_8-processed-gene-2.41-mRNA-1 protein AED:0.04 eAED:0.04 QI:0/-1/0/1/-1/1/1/0/278
MNKLSLLFIGTCIQTTLSKERFLQEDLLGKTLLNSLELREATNFAVPQLNPYPQIWYDTSIETDKNCYVEYEILPDGTENRTEYKVRSLSSFEYFLHCLNPTTSLHLTHTSACGVCSNLDDLYVYLTIPNLAGPVAQCALGDQQQILPCIQSLGFSADCAWIWFWNTVNTGQPEANGGCLETCVALATSPSNVPEGSDNPCQPIEDEEGQCGNTINGQPACSDYQWENGEYRLNACLQCDECRSGPIFQKVAGRTRRNSGIESSIARPDVISIHHNYG